MDDLRTRILASDDHKIEPVSVPEWPTVDGRLFVRVMSGAERDAFEAAFVNNRNGAALINIRAKLAAKTLCTEDGARIFTDADAKELGQKSASALDRVFAAAQRLNGIGDSDVEALAKNSAAARSGDSGSS